MTAPLIDDNTGFDEPAEAAPAATTKAALAITDDMGRIKTAVGEFDRVAAGLAAIEQAYPKDLVYDLTTTKGMRDAIAHRAAWRDPRITVEKVRKMAKAPLIALGKNIDARAAWLTEQLLEGETPIDQQIKAEEARREAEREAKAAAEFGRVLAIQEALAGIAIEVSAACGKTSDDIGALLERMNSTEPDPATFQEMMEQAKAAWAAGISKLETAHKAKLWEEAEQRRIAAEQEAQRIEAQRAAEEMARQRAENERIAAEQRAEREAMAAERAEIERQRAELQAEKNRAAAEAAAKAKRDAEAARISSEAAKAAAAGFKARKPLPDGVTAGASVNDSGQWYAADGTFMNPDGTRSIFDDVDEVSEIGFAPSADAAPSVAPAPEVRAFPPAAALRNEQPTMTLGQISTRLGFTVTADFLAALGFEAHKEKTARLYRPSSFAAICAGISAHVLALGNEAKLEAA